MTTVSFKIPESLNAMLNALSREQHIPKSELVREALRKFLQPKNPQPTAYDTIKHLCGTLKGASPDLSTNPKYLDDLGQ